MIRMCNFWSNSSTIYKDANWTWEECKLVDEIVANNYAGIPGEEALPPWLREEEPYNPYDKEKRKRFINLLCRIKGKPEVDWKREVRPDIKVTLADIKLVVKHVKGIDFEILED